jgi:17 kDa common-antigen outer membrane protein
MRAKSSIRSRLAPVAMAMAITLPPLLAGASNLSFLDNSLVSSFKEQDMKLLMESVDKALDSSDPRASGSWSNPKTGNSGEVMVTGQFTSTGGYTCKNLSVLNRTPKMQGKGNYILCAVPGRGWLVNPEARPVQADGAASAKQK